MPGQHTPALTPALDAFKSLSRLAGTTLERLAAQQRDFTPQERLAKLKESFQRFQAIPSNMPGIVEKMTEFLKALSEHVQNATLTQELKRINDSQNNIDKLAALKKLLQDEELLLACANEWNLYIDSLYGNQDREIEAMFRAHSHSAAKALESVSGQGTFDPEKKIVKDFLRLLFELIDAVLMKAGHKPAFMPSETGEHERWDPETGTVFGQHGRRVPHR